MTGLFLRRRKEHRSDEAVRRETATVLHSHRQSLRRVRDTMALADETLLEEIKRLDAAIEGAQS